MITAIIILVLICAILGLVLKSSKVKNKKLEKSNMLLNDKIVTQDLLIDAYQEHTASVIKSKMKKKEVLDEIKKTTNAVDLTAMLNSL